MAKNCVLPVLAVAARLILLSPPTAVRGAKARRGPLEHAMRKRREGPALPSKPVAVVAEERESKGNAEIAIWRKSATIKAGKE